MTAVRAGAADDRQHRAGGQRVRRDRGGDGVAARVATSASRSPRSPIWALVVLGSYRYAERLFLLLSLVFIAYPIAAFSRSPIPPGRRAADLVPHLLLTQSFLLLVVALIGTTITPYMQFYVAAAVADQGPARPTTPELDTVSGAIFADLISIFIIIATAAAIRVRAPLDLRQAGCARARPGRRPVRPQLFAIGLLGASALAAAVVPLSTAYAIGEAIGTERSVTQPSARRGCSSACSPARPPWRGHRARLRQPHPAADRGADAERDDHADPARPTSSPWPTGPACSATRPTTRLPDHGRHPRRDGGLLLFTVLVQGIYVFGIS